MPTLSSLRLAGWKSIRDQKIEFGRISVLIGANGAGKSNLVAFFSSLNHFADNHFEQFVAAEGGADAILTFGQKQTDSVIADIAFDLGVFFRVRYVPVPVNRLAPMVNTASWEVAEYEQQLRLIKVFHFHDTSARGPLRGACDINGNRGGLRRDGNNLPAVLYLYSQKFPVAYRRIVAAVKSIAPFFEDFLLEPLRLNPNQINLRWLAVGREYEFGPHQLSDGTLRAIALFTLLLGPDEDRPGLIVLDEPELGLHPAAITIFADLVSAASVRSQIVLATQSPTLVDHFEPQDIIAVNSRNGESVFERLDPVRLKTWLEEYSIGELWEQNVIGGGPY